MALSLVIVKSLRKIFRDMRSRFTNSSVYPQKGKRNHNDTNFSKKGGEKYIPLPEEICTLNWQVPIW